MSYRKSTLGFGLAALVGACFLGVFAERWIRNEPQDGLAAASVERIATGLLPTLRADLDKGEYSFFPNRRSIWVVNRTNGRMANYNFRDDEVGSVDRSRVATIDLKTFPPQDTVIQLSDRNLNNVLWVCNVRTGDVQLWQPARNGSLRSEMPLATSADLRVR